MLEKLSLFALFLLDLYFTASGLLYLRSAGEAIYGLLFLIIVWFIVWSLHKIKSYHNVIKKESFVRYYFKYLIKAGTVIANDRRMGPTKFFRLTSAFLSASVGVGVILFLILHSLATTVFSKDFVLRYWYVFLFISIYPLVIYLIKKFIQNKDETSFIAIMLTFFPLKFTQLLIFIFTFFTPLAWLMLAFLSYIIAKSTMMSKIKLE